MKRTFSFWWSVPPLLGFYYIELTVYNSLFSFVSRVLFSFVDFIIPKEPLFVKTLFVIFNKNVNIKIDIFSCFYRFAILHNTQPVLLYIFTFRQRSSKAATAASLSRSLYPLLCKLLYLFLE